MKDEWHSMIFNEIMDLGKSSFLAKSLEYNLVCQFLNPSKS
jgi:hypothetical protein